MIDEFQAPRCEHVAVLSCARPPVLHRHAVLLETRHDADHGYSLRHGRSNGVVNFLGDAFLWSQTVYEEVDTAFGVELADGLFRGVVVPESGHIINIERVSVDVHPIRGWRQRAGVHVGTERCVFATEDQIYEGADAHAGASKDDDDVHAVALVEKKKKEKKSRLNDTFLKRPRENRAREENSRYPPAWASLRVWFRMG